jgi:hypothetical protein
MISGLLGVVVFYDVSSATRSFPVEAELACSEGFACLKNQEAEMFRLVIKFAVLMMVPITPPVLTHAYAMGAGSGGRGRQNDHARGRDRRRGLAGVSFPCPAELHFQDGGFVTLVQTRMARQAKHPSNPGEVI